MPTLLALLTCKGWIDPLDLWTEKKAVRSQLPEPFWGEVERLLELGYQVESSWSSATRYLLLFETGRAGDGLGGLFPSGTDRPGRCPLPP